jgi:predicted MFS family arabinose efflux permease
MTDQAIKAERRQEVQLVLAGLSAIGVGFGFARYGYGLYLPELRREFGLSTAQLGVISSLSYVGYLAAVVLVGTLISRLGPRLMILSAGASAAAGMTLVAVTDSVVVLTVGVVLAGTSAGWVWAPYSEVTPSMLTPRRAERALAIIASGTAYGTAVAGGLALATPSDDWRLAWAAFTVIAVAVTIVNAVVLPRSATGPRGPSMSGATLARLRRRTAIPLCIAAISYGAVGSVYWTFAIDLIGSGSAQATGAAFWTLLGIAGTAGAAAPMLFRRMGLRASHLVLFGLLAAGIALLSIAPEHGAVVVLSAVIFGPTFMATASLLAVWSFHTFERDHAAGFSMVVFFLGLGGIAGPAVVGAAAGSFGLRGAFAATAVVAFVTIACRPNRAVGAYDPGMTHGSEVASVD